MADSGLRRRVSTRNRGEPPAKLRKTSPAAEDKSNKGGAAAAAASSTAAAAIPAARKVSERKVGEKKTPGKSTPAKASKSTPRGKVKESPKVATPAPAPEPEAEPQEVEEPAVYESMATLMEKSRQRWINEGGIFDKFWTKPPRKKKGQPAVNMPTKAQMNLIEIGQTRIIIEPHVFDIHMYGVKKPALSWQTPIAGPQSTGGAVGQSAQSTPQRQMSNPYPRPSPATQNPSTIPPAPSPSPSVGAGATTPNANPSRGVAPNPYAIGSSSGGTKIPGNASTSTPKPAGAATQPAPQTTPDQSASTAAAPTQPPTVKSPAAPTNGTIEQTPQSEAEPMQQQTNPRAATAAGSSTTGPSSSTATAPVTATTSTPNAASAPATVPPAPGNAQTHPGAAQQTPIPTPTPRAQTARPPQPPSSSQQRSKQPPPQQQQQQQQHAPHPDPVIQMLAQRAATDPALKELMKIVAAGSTSPEKLKEFQRHIDDINAIVQKQKQAAAANPSSTINATGRGNKRQQQQQQQQPGQGGSQQRQGQQQYRASAPFIASKPSAPPPPPRHDLGNIVFDFIRGGDCFLLPKSSIIQHMPDGMTTLISFIVTRKGKDVTGARLKAEVEYYQPMTMTLLTVEQKIRDMISQVVLPKEQANREMLEIMDRCTLAPSRGVMLEVPEGVDAMELDRPSEREAVAEGYDGADPIKAEWDAPDSLLPM